jgi:nitroimidazol reductase NimA-like FMN-containing flavoprotein (pyridoxamine 5'-phosphate oxidase superfamily)
MRRKDKALQNEAALHLLVKGEYGILSTVDIKGQPYGIPLNYVFWESHLYFHCALEGRKLDNLFANPKISFCVIGHTKILPEEFNTEYESVIVFGEVSVVHGEERSRALFKLIEKYSPRFVEEGRRYIELHDSKTEVCRIDIQSMTGKAKTSAKL